MKVNILKLGTMVTDVAADIKGMLTGLQINMSGHQHYSFQPAGLNPETKEPIDSYWLDRDRVKGAQMIEKDLPLEVLGTQVEDKASAFKGMAISLNHHLNGCNHFVVKPAGKIEKTGEAIKANDFDIRRLKGEAIKEMTEEEQEKSEQDTPSPVSHSNFNPGQSQ